MNPAKVFRRVLDGVVALREIERVRAELAQARRDLAYATVQLARAQRAAGAGARLRRVVGGYLEGPVVLGALVRASEVYDAELVEAAGGRS
jgi:hypothetical protein